MVFVEFIWSNRPNFEYSCEFVWARADTAPVEDIELSIGDNTYISTNHRYNDDFLFALINCLSFRALGRHCQVLFNFWAAKTIYRFKLTLLVTLIILLTLQRFGLGYYFLWDFCLMKFFAQFKRHQRKRLLRMALHHFYHVAVSFLAVHLRSS